MGWRKHVTICEEWRHHGRIEIVHRCSGVTGAWGRIGRIKEEHGNGQIAFTFGPVHHSADGASVLWHECGGAAVENNVRTVWEAHGLLNAVISMNDALLERTFHRCAAVVPDLIVRFAQVWEAAL